MTIASQLKQTIASLKGVQSTLETFSTHEENQEAKALLEKNGKRLTAVIDDFEKRLSTIEFEEPQYKGF